jgi:hypothetical protein
MGLTEAELDWFCSAINDLKEQGVDYEERTRALVPEYIRIAREPRPGPSSFVVVSKVRDIATRRVQRIGSRAVGGINIA